MLCGLRIGLPYPILCSYLPVWARLFRTSSTSQRWCSRLDSSVSIMTASDAEPHAQYSPTRFPSRVRTRPNTALSCMASLERLPHRVHEAFCPLLLLARKRVALCSVCRQPVRSVNSPVPLLQHLRIRVSVHGCVNPVWTGQLSRAMQSLLLLQKGCILRA